MQETVPQALMHMSPALVMGTLLLVNLVLRLQRDNRREAVEARRLALALAVELRSLLDSYNQNLDLIASGSAFLVSTRAAGTIYRGNLGRLLPNLDDAALAAVVGAFAHQQRIEAYLSACTKPNGPNGVHLLPRQTPLQEVKRHYADGCRVVGEALAALERPEGKEAMGLRPIPRLRQALGIQM